MKSTWTSSNTSVASVSSAGVVTGVATGTVTISVTMSGFTGTTDTASVTVVPAPPNWTLTGNLFHQTAGQIATLLNDGTVLIAGGEDSSNAVLDLAEIYTPSTGLFTPTAGNMVDDRTLPTATLLPDGTVLIAGGGSGTGGGGDQEPRKSTIPRPVCSPPPPIHEHDPGGRHRDTARYRHGPYRWNRRAGYYDQRRPLRPVHANLHSHRRLECGPRLRDRHPPERAATF